MDDKNPLNDGEKPQTPADREAKAKRRILVGIAAGALLVAGLITGGIYLSGRQGGTPTALGSGTMTVQQEQVDGEKPCEHDWTVTYKTVHHDAVTHTENVPITGEVLVSEGFTREVTDSPAYDESVPDKLVCTLCGEEKPATAE